MYSFTEIQDKLNELKIENYPLKGTTNMIQLGEKNTTIHSRGIMDAYFMLPIQTSGQSWNIPGRMACVKRTMRRGSQRGGVFLL